MTDQGKGLLLTALGVLAIVPDSLLIRLIDAPPLTVAFWRAGFAALVLWIGLAAFYRGRLAAVLRGLGAKGALFALCQAVATLLFVLAVQLTTVANAVFLVSLTPVLAALVSRLALGERLSRRTMVTILLCLVGAGVIASGSLQPGAEGLAGDLCALGAATALAVGFTTARAARAISMVPATGVAYLVSTLALLPFARPETMQAADFGWAALLGCVFVPLGTSLMALGPRYIPSAEVALLLMLEAILAPLLVWVVVGEEPGARTLAGGALVLGVLAVSNAIALGRGPPRAVG